MHGWYDAALSLLEGSKLKGINWSIMMFPVDDEWRISRFEDNSSASIKYQTILLSSRYSFGIDDFDTQPTDHDATMPSLAANLFPHGGFNFYSWPLPSSNARP